MNSYCKIINYSNGITSFISRTLTVVGIVVAVRTFR